MSKTMVQIRNVPEEFHRRLKARAATEGMSMSDYILRELGKALDRPDSPGGARSPACEARSTPQAARGRRHPDGTGRAVIVLDASALVELLVGTAAGRIVAARIADPAVGLHVPHLADVEVAQALRRYVRDRDLDVSEAEAALDDLSHPGPPTAFARTTARACLGVARNLSAYDAVYVALAEAVDGVSSRAMAPSRERRASARESNSSHHTLHGPDW